MKKNLSGFKLQVLLLLFGMIVISCSKDKEEEPTPDTTNQLEYNGQKYTFKSGLVEDFGQINVYNTSATHHNHDYTILDGSFTKMPDDSYGITDASTTVMVYTELFSPGVAGFKTGTFTFVNPTNDNQLTEAQLQTKYKDKAFFNTAFILIDSNNNKIPELTDIIALAAGGTITVTGSASSPTLEFNLTLTDGKTLTGSYQGGFDFSDQTD